MSDLVSRAAVLAAINDLYNRAAALGEASDPMRLKAAALREAFNTIRALPATPADGEVDRLREALHLCERAASGDTHVIARHCTVRDRKIDLSSGTPLGIRVNTIGEIARATTKDTPT